LAFDWLDRMMGWGKYSAAYRTTCYRPGGGCNPYGGFCRRTCTYPQARYTSPSCNPCVGCCTTTRRPATRWSYQPQSIPYVAYPGVYSAPGCGTRCSPPANVVPAVPPNSSSGFVQPWTLPEQPSPELPLEPIPNPGVQLKSVPEPLQLTNPHARTAQLSAPQVYLAASPVKPVQVPSAVRHDDGGWRASHD
jgi:hypothetical protein